MSDPVKLIRQIPLDGAAIAYDDLTIRSVPSMGKIMLQRANNVDDDAMADLGKLFNLSMPLQVGCRAVSKDGDMLVLCIGPTMWFVICAEDKAGALAADIERAVSKATITAAVMTDQYICLNIEGRHARALFAKGCALDLRAEVFSEHKTARTMLAHVNIILWRMHEDTFCLILDVSLGNYLWYWLEEAAKEFLI